MAEGFETRFEANYPDILRLARARLAREQSPISTVTLAHELYLNLRDRQNLKFASAAEFMAYASRAMRSLLVDMARERLAQKRSADLIPLTLGAAAPDFSGTPEQLIALDDALARLGAAEPRLMKVAELRVIMGMQVDEIADALGVSEPTVKRDWQRARAFLHDALGVAP
ncbi:MAG TPA: ECF-type sigma factor [Steroidobacteraceae bacterium]